jgi:hypothetical protein
LTSFLIDGEPSTRLRLLTSNPRGIFHPLGAAFFSNASYTETVKILKQTDVSIEPFALAGARKMFAYNYTSDLTQAVPPTPDAFNKIVAAELPRYAVLWNARFKNISVANYKVWLAPVWDRDGALMRNYRMAFQKSLQYPGRNGSVTTTSPHCLSSW